jgi:uncharacterized membrane protein
MSSEESGNSRQDESFYIPPAGAPMTNEKKTEKKRPGADWLGVVYMVVGLFVLIAAFQLYFVVQELIRTWISDQFVPLVSAVYYIVVIVIGVWLLREYIRNQ